MSRKRRLCQYHGPEPSVEEIEAEFWRIVETPDEVRAVPLHRNPLMSLLEKAKRPCVLGLSLESFQLHLVMSACCLCCLGGSWRIVSELIPKPCIHQGCNDYVLGND